MIRTFKVSKEQTKEECPVCHNKFKIDEEIILCPIQAPKGDYFINAIALIIHLNCYYVEDK